MNLVASKKALIINFLVVGWYCSPGKIDNHSECQLLLILGSLIKCKINYFHFPDFFYEFDDFSSVELIKVDSFETTDIAASKNINHNLILTEFLNELFLDASRACKEFKNS